MIDWSQPGKMLNKFLLISMCCAAAFGAGQVSIIDTPKSLQFKRGAVDPLPATSFGEIFAAALGYSVRGSENWSALKIVDPFNAPQLAVVVVVSGNAAVVGTPLAGKTTFALTGAGAQEALDDLEDRIPSVQHLNVADAEAKQTKRKPFVALKPESNEDEREYVQQVSALRDQAASIAEGSQLVTIAVSAAGLQHSSAAAQAEAQKLLQEAVEQLSRDLKKRFDGQVLVVVAQVEQEVQQRQKRQAAAVDPYATWNLAEEYNDDYPVVFNIILWFGVVFVFSLVAISYAIGNMDPGRDSIIYRMTSTRMKKDN